MPEDPQDALAGSSPAPDASADSSAAPETPAQPQAPGQAPPLPSQPEGAKPWNMPPEERWNELRQQAAEARAQAAATMQVLQQVQAGQAAPQAPAPNPLEGLVNHPDPATAQFWQQVERVSTAIADRKAQERLGPLTQALDLGRQQLAQVTVAQFRRDNPDIAPGSAEEQAIVARVNQGYPLEEAKAIVMYQVLNQRLSQRSQTNAQRQAAQRAQASPEATPGMPATAGGSQTKGNYRETMDAELRAAGL